jgi:site-specific DNA-methyltransferase (adenine-specific)
VSVFFLIIFRAVEEKKFNLIFGDCLTEMETLISKGIKVDMILCDLPYGTTACAWDAVIPFEPLWSCYKRLIKENGAIVLFGSEPFSSHLRMSNIKQFKYDWVWDKVIGVGFQIAKYRPMQRHGMISVFCDGTPNYYPIKPKRRFANKGYATPSKVSPLAKNDKTVRIYDDQNPTSIIEHQKVKNGKHPSEKPIELIGYLIQTYTKEGELVLDNTMGSGTTGEACSILKRDFIGIEKDAEYFAIAESRICAVENQIKLF